MHSEISPQNVRKLLLHKKTFFFISWGLVWKRCIGREREKKFSFERNSFVSYFSELRRGSHDSKINYLVMKTRPFMVKYWHDKTLETREKVTLEQHDFQHFSCFGTFPFRSWYHFCKLPTPAGENVKNPSMTASKMLKTITICTYQSRVSVL